ncbi:essential MCU regulator, mitochondrial-like isoform X2 [Asterias amurensis]|uniref:essential MCU regulator, mitochondrial-like isoform X2 n=1 Tax=Asterias amurensis TaxID=7602 RepID=UPI003AB82AD4
MATLGRIVTGILRKETARNVCKNQLLARTQQVRCKTTTETGALLAKPTTINLGLSKIVLVTVPFLYLGATISKEGAAFLEENDIFIPDDDDD